MIIYVKFFNLCFYFICATIIYLSIYLYIKSIADKHPYIKVIFCFALVFVLLDVPIALF